MIYLTEQLPAELWEAAVPGVPRRTVRMIVAHVHNSRCAWIRTLGKPHGVAVPAKVDRFRVSRAQACRAMDASNNGGVRLARAAAARAASEGEVNLRF